jgi:hypothetical protein
LGLHRQRHCRRREHPLTGAADSEALESRITRWLSTAPKVAFIAYAVFAAFASYFCMYAFRKPFAVGSFPGQTLLWGIGAVDTKIVLIVAQILGYCASKFLGIKVVSEMTPGGRARAIVIAIAVAEAALVLFGLVPPPYNALCMFLNGLPLGMVWGLVFGFLEGRRVSDGLGAGLCASFIVASGFVKTAGKLVLDSGVSEAWMPAVTGALFILPMLLFVWLLARLPPPSKADEAERLRRVPMDRQARWRFFKAVAPGLLLLTAAYVLLTAYRDFRDNFARELWDALGYADQPAVLTTAELPVAVGSLIAVASCMAIKNSRVALLAIHGALLFGALLIGGSTLLYERQLLGPGAWMVLVGLGLYVGYVPYNCVLFDRLIPAVGHLGTAGFLIYFTDAFGYLGSVALLLYKNFGGAEVSWLSFFGSFSHLTGWSSLVLFVLSALYFARRPVAA